MQLSSEERDFQIAANLLRSKLGSPSLEGVLADEEVLLLLQQEVLDLSDEERAARLAELVISLFGIDLLKSKRLRSALCSACKVPNPATWKPGSASAFNTVRMIGLPTRFAGVQQTVRHLPVMRIANVPPERLLEPYQNEVLSKALSALLAKESVLVSLPTGAGKTLVAMSLLKALVERTARDTVCAVWVAHTEELCEQAIASAQDVFQHFAGDLDVIAIRYWGNYARAHDRGERHDAICGDSTRALRIIVTTPATALRLTESSNGLPAGQLIQGKVLLFIDEAHRAGAATYRRLISRLTSNRGLDARLIGMSATPVRETYASEPFRGTRVLASVFDHLVEPTDSLPAEVEPAEALRSMGVLAKLIIDSLEIEPGDIRGLSTAIYTVLAKGASLKPALVFTRTVAEAKVLSLLLREQGLSSEHVSSDTAPVSRNLLSSKLRTGRIDVVCNCEILTTGFDAPRISSVFLARPTSSPVLYKQMIGRGLRGPRFGGSKECHVFLCGIQLPFASDPNTTQFARQIWNE